MQVRRSHHVRTREVGGIPARAAWPRRVLAVAAVAALATVGLATSGVPAGATGADTVAGGAVGVESTGLVDITPTPTVTLPSDGASQSTTVLSLPLNPLASSGSLSATTGATHTGAANEQVQSTASVENLSVLGALPAALVVGAVTTSCSANAAGATGSTTGLTLSVGGTPVTLPVSIPANTVIALPAPLTGLVSVTLNQQVHSYGPGTSSMTVNGVVIQLLVASAVVTTVTVGHSSCTASGPDIGYPPTATGLTPTTGTTVGGTPITITGTNFGASSTVTVGGTPATDVTVVSPTELQAVTPAHAAGTVPVVVANPSGTATTPVGFTYVAGTVPGHPAPVVTGISPTSGDPAGGNTVIIQGTNLCDVTAVFFGTTAAPSFSVNAACTVLTVTAPPGSGTVPVTVVTLGGTTTAPQGYTYLPPGYWMVAGDGGVFSFGGAHFFGSMGASHLNQPVVAMATTPDHGGYWLFAGDGGVFSFGDAQFYGSMGSQHLNAPIVAAESSADGKGYRMFAADGGVFDFGDAQFEGSLPGIHVVPNQPIHAATSSPFGQGYWLVASDGGVFSFGSAAFEGSTGGQHLNAPITTMSATPDGDGYWLFASDGGVFGFGDSAFFGSMGGTRLNGPITAGTATSTGKGYWLFATDGGVFTFGDAPFLGSLGNDHLNSPIFGGVGF